MPEQPSDTPQNTLDRDSETILNAYQQAVHNDDALGAQGSAFQLMSLASEHFRTDPSPDLLLKREARRHTEAGEWTQSEAVLRRGLDLAVAEGSAMGENSAFDGLSALHNFLGQPQRALEDARSATEAARRANIVPLLTSALERQARACLGVGDPKEALALADEMLHISPEEKIHSLSRARALILRARCHAKLREWASVPDDLDTAEDLLAPMSGVAVFAGVQSALAHWWEVRASLRAHRGDLAGAVDAGRECVGHARIVSTRPQLGGPYKFAFLARTLRLLGSRLLAVKDEDAAETAFEESRAIRRTIHQPDLG